MKKMFRLSIISLALAFSVSGYAEEHKGHACTDCEKKGVETLSSELRALLSQEMIAIQKGMMSMVQELASGDYDSVAKTATNIKESFILKQKLTKKQKNELHHKLPESFVEMDGGFHKDAEMLAHVAKKRNAELANFYFSKMNNSCTNCHSKFAKHRFPAFAAEKEESGHHH